MKTVSNIVLYLGILLVIVGISMFLYAMHMFTARGEFSALERHLAEISMVLWIPTIFGGLNLIYYK